jgi:hypothetical protein
LHTANSVHEFRFVNKWILLFVVLSSVGMDD